MKAAAAPVSWQKEIHHLRKLLDRILRSLQMEVSNLVVTIESNADENTNQQTVIIIRLPNVKLLTPEDAEKHTGKFFHLIHATVMPVYLNCEDVLGEQESKLGDNDMGFTKKVLEISRIIVQVDRVDKQQSKSYIKEDPSIPCVFAAPADWRGSSSSRSQRGLRAVLTRVSTGDESSPSRIECSIDVGDIHVALSAEHLGQLLDLNGELLHSLTSSTGAGMTSSLLNTAPTAQALGHEAASPIPISNTPPDFPTDASPNSPQLVRSSATF